MVLLLVAFWFYTSALKVGKDPWLWLSIGVLSYYATRVFWTYLIVKPIMGKGFFNHSMAVGTGIELSAILAGSAVAALIRLKVIRATTNPILHKATPTIEDDEDERSQ